LVKQIDSKWYLDEKSIDTFDNEINSEKYAMERRRLNQADRDRYHEAQQRMKIMKVS